MRHTKVLEHQYWWEKMDHTHEKKDAFWCVLFTHQITGSVHKRFMERGKVLREMIVLKFPCGNLVVSSDFKISICLSSKDLVLQVPMYWFYSTKSCPGQPVRILRKNKLPACVHASKVEPPWSTHMHHPSVYWAEPFTICLKLTDTLGI